MSNTKEPKHEESIVGIHLSELTKLEPKLMKMVDEGKIEMTPAVEILYLKTDEQKLLIETIDSEQAVPSLSQAQRMKRLSQEDKLSGDIMLRIMMEQKE